MYCERRRTAWFVQGILPVLVEPKLNPVAGAAAVVVTAPKAGAVRAAEQKMQLMLKTHSNRCTVGGFVLFFSPPPNSTEIGESLRKRVLRLLVWSNFIRLDTQLFEKSEYNYIILKKVK